MFRKKIFNLIILPLFTLTFLALFFVTPEVVNAQGDSYGVNDEAMDEMQLDSDLQPRESLVGIINIALSFLGLIAVIIVIYGGFVWMTSGGNEEKINNAKKILKNGLIGLVIILLSWGIATWVLAQFSGDGELGQTCTPGEVESVLVCNPDIDGNPCYRTRTCDSSGNWGNWVDPCICSDNGNGGEEGDSCDGDPNTAGCFVNHDMCGDGYYCSSDTCTCQPQGDLGDTCDADTTTDTCTNPEDNLCGPYLNCDEDECICLGPPVITNVSPIGGFCENDINEPCLSDNDCPESSCNTSTPNGAPNNFVTILGHNFGDEPGEVLFNELSGNSPNDLNNNCVNTWNNNQIIIAVPLGASDGPITVETSAGETGSTNDDMGPDIEDFKVNDINRPGLCSVDPESGGLNQEITYQGINFFNAEAYFGSYEQNIKALNSDLNNETYGDANVPNINNGQVTTFAQGTISGELLYSNYLEFIKEAEEDPDPYINSFSPEKGAPGQYVTIYGGGFGNSKGNSQVYFGNTEANYNFPEVCLHSVWSENKIIVKVPEGVDDGDYMIKIELADGETDTSLLNPDQFEVDSSLDLSPSLCKVSPVRGQAETEVTFWGEYFGDYDDSVSAVFHANELVESQVEKEGSTDYFSAQVPSDAISGPLNVRKDGLNGNSLNFEIGPCQSDADCGPDICCPSDTYKANRCAASINDCSIDIPNSVFEWSFDTDLDNLDFCQELDTDECLVHEDCCFDGADNNCISLDNREVFAQDDGEDIAGYCKRWDCEDKDTEKPCDDQSPNIDGDFENLNICYSNCNPIPPGPGVSCFNEPANSCNFEACGGSGITFSCLTESGELGNYPSDCGACCCSMIEDNCSDIHEVLHCQPNQEPCTGDDRGLCCGCSSDDQCGDINFVGCGSDTCCRDRPKVIESDMFPQDGQEDVCRNTIISIPFNQRMNIDSLRTNILLLEERADDDVCPGGSMVLETEEKKNFFASLFVNIRNSFRQIFTGFSSIALATPSSENLYCLIPGTTRVEQEAERSVLKFHPRNLLRDETNYYLVVKGDKELDSQSGVLSAWEIGMNEDGYQGDDSVEFNLVSFSNSFISKFTTLNDQDINSGVCEIDYVEVSPSSYLFNTNENDINENDEDDDSDTFDTVRDKDKVFHSTAYTFDDQAITPVDGYNWDWQWTIGNNSVLEEKLTVNLSDNQFFAKVKSDITDASTYLEAKVDMSDYEDSNFNMLAHEKSGQADITVFICRNPWPALSPHENNWDPWQDDVYNYKFYYCRDDGSSAYEDDLPALIHPAIEHEDGHQMICSTTNQPCTVEEIDDNSCGPHDEGYCVSNVLKESYFFRQSRPSAGVITNVEDTEAGGEVSLEWEGSSDIIYHSSDENLRGHYRIYYAKDGEEFSYLEVDISSSDYCSHDDVENEYSCNYTISDLENDELYVFRVSAVSRTNVETFFSNELKVVPTDKTAPSVPADCGYIFVYENEDEENDIEAIKIKCSQLDDDVELLKLYHGVSSGSYGQYFESEVSDSEYDFNLDIDLFSVSPNYFAMSALDEYGNESEKSTEIEVNLP